MISRALNSGAINAVAFPGAVAGASLTQMNGEVSVVGTVSTIRLRLAAVASTSASAVTSAPSTKIIIQLQAQTPAEAVNSMSVVGKTPIYLAAASAAAVTSAGCQLKFRAGASVSATASAPSVASIKLVKLSASGAASASDTASSRALVPRSITQIAAAVTSADTVRKIPFAILQPAVMISSAVMAIKYRTPASAQATAFGTCFALKSVSVSCLTVATAATSSPHLRVVISLAPVPTPASATPSLVRVAIKSTIAASGTAVASTTASTTITHQVAASVTAGVSGSTVAIDYGLAYPAPEERQMIVSAQDRYMKVPE